MISNKILRDKELTKDRGVLCTICSLPDGWEFSVAGLSAIVPDGRDALTVSLQNLGNMGYLVRTRCRSANGRYASEIEVFAERQTKMKELDHEGNTVTEKTLRKIRQNIIKKILN